MGNSKAPLYIEKFRKSLVCSGQDTYSEENREDSKLSSLADPEEAEGMPQYCRDWERNLFVFGVSLCVSSFLLSPPVLSSLFFSFSPST